MPDPVATSTSTPTSEAQAVDLRLHSSSSESGLLSSESRKKNVRFAADTLVNRENNVAITISRHLYVKELGYTQYHIQVMYKGIQWTIYKRYRDFEAFHAQVLQSGKEMDFPPLPKKRWFEKQRWLNRFDESYSFNRRVALQDYLRNMARIPFVRDRLQEFRDFLHFPPDALREFEEEMARGDLEQHQYICYEQDGNGRLVQHRPGDVIEFESTHPQPSSSTALPNSDSPVEQPETRSIPDDVNEEAASDDDGYFEDDELDDHEIDSLKKHSTINGGANRTRARDSVIETRLETDFDDDGNPIQSETR